MANRLTAAARRRSAPNRETSSPHPQLWTRAQTRIGRSARPRPCAAIFSGGGGSQESRRTDAHSWPSSSGVAACCRLGGLLSLAAVVVAVRAVLGSQARLRSPAATGPTVAARDQTCGHAHTERQASRPRRRRHTRGTRTRSAAQRARRASSSAPRPAANGQRRPPIGH